MINQKKKQGLKFEITLYTAHCNSHDDDDDDDDD